MNWTAVFVFLFGLVVGSFLNSVIWRLACAQGLFDNSRDRKSCQTVSPLKGRSYCPKCQHQLSWRDLIPVVSFVVLGGRCRYCKQGISIQYPLVEIGTGLIFVLVFWHLGFGFDLAFGFWHWAFLELLYLLVIASLLIILFVYDLKHYLLPDKILLPAIGIAVGDRVFEFLNVGNWNLFGISDLGFGVLPAFAFLMIVLISKGTAMGMGDAKLAVFMGLFLGWPNILVALFLAFFSGAAIGVLLILLKRKTLKSEVPFGPFLIAGTFAAFLWGEALVDFFSEV